MTDIIPMLEELHPLIDLQTGHPSLVSRDNLNTSSDDDEDDLEEDASTDENQLERKIYDFDNWKDVIDLNYLDMDNNSKLEGMMDLQRAKNILKFELDKRLMDLQAADAVQKMEAASRFRVQVPSISTGKQNPFDSSNSSDEIIELPHVPDSAPSCLLPRKNLFDLAVNQNMAHDSALQETWTPLSYFSARRHIKHGNLHVRHSTSLRHNSFKKVNNFEAHIVEADSIDEFNSLFKCRMEEVLVQSISESSISQPLTVKLEDELSEPLSSDSGTGTHFIDGSSVEDSDPQFAQLNDEALVCATSNATCRNESIEEKSSEALLAGNKDYSELPNELLKSGDPQTADSSEIQVQVIEATGH